MWSYPQARPTDRDLTSVTAAHYCYRYDDTDATATAAWATLNELYAGTTTPDPGRLRRRPRGARTLHSACADLHVDLSKNLLDAPDQGRLGRGRGADGLAERREAMFETSDQCHREPVGAALRPLRRPAGDELVVDDVEVVVEVHAGPEKIYASPTRSATGNGSASPAGHRDGRQYRHRWLRPRAVAVYEAPQALCAAEHFVSLRLQYRPISPRRSPTDPRPPSSSLPPRPGHLGDVDECADGAGLALERSRGAGAIEDTDEARRAQCENTSSPCRRLLDKVAAFWYRLRPMPSAWDWVGGRYSVDSARRNRRRRRDRRKFPPTSSAASMSSTGTSSRRPLRTNVPVLMGMLNVWYVDFFHAKSHAVLPACAVSPTGSRPTCSN